MKIKSTFAAGLLTACMALFAAPVSATVVTTTAQTSAFNFTDSSGAAILSFDGFNAALGRLVGVIVQFTLNETLSSTAYNIGNSAVTIGVPNAISATSTVSATGPLGLTASTVLTTPGFVGTIPVGGPTVLETATTPANFLVGPAVLNGNPTSLASYIGGTNSVSISVNGIGTQNGSLPQNAFSGYKFQSNGVVSLQYMYDIPEPASIALFALGLIALGAWYRRKA